MEVGDGVEVAVLLVRMLLLVPGELVQEVQRRNRTRRAAPGRIAVVWFICFKW